MEFILLFQKGVRNTGPVQDWNFEGPTPDTVAPWWLHYLDLTDCNTLLSLDRLPLSAALLDRYLMVQVSPTSWSLQHNPGFTFSALCNGLLRLPYRDFSAIHLASMAHLNHGGRFCNPLILVSFITLKADHRLPTWDGAWLPPLITFAVTSFVVGF